MYIQEPATDKPSKNNSDCGCKIMCDCSENKERCDCNCGSLFTCDEHLSEIDKRFAVISHLPYF